WSLRYPLVDGQGNFGSMDGDSPAAMRYTEARLRRISDEILADLGKDTVDFALNFDDTLEEPTVLPTKIPNLLVNGASGIAVGMATNMLPHNLSEVIDGVIATVDKPEITIEELMEYIKAPDFPTGGTIYGYQGVQDAFHTGRGRIVLRGKARIETSGNRETIIIYEIPYQVNKSNLVAKIGDLVNEKKIEGISGVGDESSSRDGVRIVVDVKRDAMASVVLSQLYKYTALQTSFGVNNVALVKGRPMTLNLKDMIEEFIDFRQEVIVRRTQYDLNKALQRAHILVGLLIALDYIDAVISLIRNSKTVEEARSGLKEGAFIDDVKKFNEKFEQLISFSSLDTIDTHIVADGEVLSEAQARAILDMRLQKLTGLERDKVQGEYDELQKEIEHLREILASKEIREGIIKDELTEVKERFGDERSTDITYADGEISIEDLIGDEEMVITISHLGYIKRTSTKEYRTQSRGGRGAKGSNTRDTDFIEHMFVATNHNYLLFFTEQGKCHWIRVYEIPEASKTSSGRVIQNLMQIPKDDKVKAYIILKDLKDQEFVDNHYILFCTKKGLVKKTPVQAFARPRAGGIIAININEGDQLLEARLTDGNSQVLIANKGGNAIRFDEAKVRSMGRTATGVRGITLANGKDEAVGMVVVGEEDKDKTILVISEKGNGKRSEVEEYRLTNRGGKGVKTMQVTDKTGAVIAIKLVSEEDDLMITNISGIVIRMAVSDIRVMGRATQGVRVIRLDKNDDIADVAVVRDSDGDDDDLEEGINEDEIAENWESSESEEATDDEETTND
ncbi:MAG: DNA gyrase subunit A, partial [Bacteroidota bacterium]